MKTTRSISGPFYLGACVLLTCFAAVFAMACASTHTATLDSKKADEIAHASLVGPTDLPGSGWKVAENDSFLGDLPKTEACASFQSLLDDSAQGRTGHAERRFESRPAASRVLTQVRVEAEVHDNTRRFDALLTRYKELNADGTVRTCLEEARNLALTPLSQSVKFASVSPSQPSPAGGLAVGFAIDLATAQGTAAGVREDYVWPVGNTVFDVSFIGGKGDVTPALVKSVIDKLISNAKVAAKSN